MFFAHYQQVMVVCKHVVTCIIVFSQLVMAWLNDFISCQGQSEPGEQNPAAEDGDIFCVEIDASTRDVYILTDVFFLHEPGIAAIFRCFHKHR